LEANPAFPQHEGMIIALPPNKNVVAVDKYTNGSSGASPLTD
jgi:hypothetical protein